MRIDELDFPKTIDDAAEILGKFGYKELGKETGFYGKVFHKAGETSVLKLYKTEDYPYTLYVEFCRKQTNPHFPRFSRQSVEIRGTPYRAVKTELLKAGDPLRFKRLSRYFRCIEYESWPTEFDDTATIKRLSSEYPQTFPRYIKWLKDNPSMAEAFRLLKNEFIGKNVRFDLHEENMLMRGDTVVIIDPIAPPFS